MTQDWEAALHDGDLQRLRVLADDGAEIDARDRYGQNGLMIAATRGYTEVVTLLIERGADLDHTAKFGLSALMLAVVNGHVEIVRRLVQAGADAELRGSGAPDFHGKNARDLATAQGREDLLDALARGAAPDDAAPG